MSPLAIALAVGCSVSFVLMMHYRKEVERTTEVAREFADELMGARRSIARLQPQARLGDPESLSRLRDTQYDFVVNSYGFEYAGRTGDLIDEQILMYGLWEKGLAFFMRDYLQACEGERVVFVDVGCNVGHHSLFLSQYASEVHGFDPYLPAIERFEDLIQRNGMTNVSVHPVGLGQEEAEVPFYVPYDGNFGSGTFSEGIGGGSGRQELILKIVRGDDWFSSHGIDAVELIKIDIEGYEEAALIGMQQTLADQRPVVLFELTPAPQGTIASWDQLRGLFPEDYRFIAVMDYVWRTPVDGKYITREFNAEQAAEFFAAGTQGTFVAYPAEKQDRIPLRRE